MIMSSRHKHKKIEDYALHAIATRLINILELGIIQYFQHCDKSTESMLEGRVNSVAHFNKMLFLMCSLYYNKFNIYSMLLGRGRGLVKRVISDTCEEAEIMDYPLHI